MILLCSIQGLNKITGHLQVDSYVGSCHFLVGLFENLAEVLLSGIMFMFAQGQDFCFIQLMPNPF